MLLAFTKKQFAKALPHLLELWPKKGKWSKERLRRAASLTGRREASSAEEPLVKVDTCIDFEQLRTVGERYAVQYSVPWKYQKFFEKGRPSPRKALKLRPHAKIPIALNGADTTATVNTVRRLKIGGKPHFIRADMTIDTKYIPIILERETLCTCEFCGTTPVGDETSCRSCGAPLPPC